MIQKNLLLQALLAIFSAPAHAVDWYYIGDGHNGQTAILYDKDSIKRNASKVRMWTWIVFRNYEPKFNNGNSVKQYWEFDCKDEFQEMIYSAVYRDGNSVLTEKGNPKDARPVIPGSFDEVFYGVACGKQSKSIHSGNVNETDIRNTIWKSAE